MENEASRFTSPLVAAARSVGGRIHKLYCRALPTDWSGGDSGVSVGRSAGIDCGERPICRQAISEGLPTRSVIRKNRTAMRARNPRSGSGSALAVEFHSMAAERNLGGRDGKTQ